MNPELVEKDPKLAEVVGNFIARFSRNYDFSKIEDQANFAEGMRELGRFTALHNSNARMRIMDGPNGITSIDITLV